MRRMFFNLDFIYRCMRVRPSLSMRNLFNFLLFCGMLLGAGNVSAEVIYVNVNNLNPLQDGTSWNTAYISLQSGLDKAEMTPGHNEIWVAKGTYIPSKIYSPKNALGIPVPGGAYGIVTPNLQTFDLPNDVAIFGGFKGTETRLDQRNPKKNPTILSGGGFFWHVVTLGNDITQTGVSAELDGLSVIQGNAAGPAGFNALTQPFNYGHGFGGGVYVTFGSNIKVRDVLFTQNAAPGVIVPGIGPNGEGGAFYSNSSNVHISKSSFFCNTAGLEGGAVEILNTFETSPHTSTIESCIFEGNSAFLFGGAMVTEGTLQDSKSFSVIKDCIFKFNRSIVGGAIAVDSLTVNILDSTFESNSADVAGGAFSTTNVVNTIATGFASAKFTPFTTAVANCSFFNNRAEGNMDLHDVMFGGPAASGIDFPIGGGAIAVYINGYLDVDKCTFERNVAQSSDGGAILNGRSSGENIVFSGADGFIVQTKIKNSTFVDNESPTANGGAIASLPGTFFPHLPITEASTVLSAKESFFKHNQAGVFGGAIFLEKTTATLKCNCYSQNKAAEGRSIYAIESYINGKFFPLFVKP